MRRMYSKKQLEKIISEVSGDLIEVKNIKQLNDEECNGLKVGDIVAKKTGKQYHCYIVTFKQDKGGLCLSYFDASCIETQSYDYIEGHWVYNSEDKANIKGLPNVTGVDNGKVLEVIAGEWAKGGKKVNVIAPPASTTLTDEEISQINEGVFINGEFLGFKNPVLFPSIQNPSGEFLSTGIIFGSASNGQDTYIRNYRITHNKLILFSTAFTINFSSNRGGLIIDGGNNGIFLNGNVSYNNKTLPVPVDNTIATFIYRKNIYEYYVPVAVTGITSGDDLAGVQDNLVNAMKDHLEVEINGHRCRFEKEDSSHVIYSWKDEVDNGAILQINMISLLIASPNTLSFNLMKFAPVV